MQTIYLYENEFDKNVILEKMDKITQQIQEEKNKKDYNKDREKELLYAQFIQGLKLNII